jgi:hypothetical protein
VVFKPTKTNGVKYDTTRYYRRGGKGDHRLQRPISREEFNKLSKAQREEYTPIREQINDPRIDGPYDTHWGMTDFDPQLQDARIGLPTLPGQVTNAK